MDNIQYWDETAKRNFRDFSILKNNKLLKPATPTNNRIMRKRSHPDKRRNNINNELSESFESEEVMSNESSAKKKRANLKAQRKRRPLFDEMDYQEEMLDSQMSFETSEESDGFDE